MLGQVYSDQKYTVIILAGGMGTRMGEASEYIPKALAPLGNQRAIDWIIWKHLPVAKSFVIGTGWQADLLESYVKGRYPNLPITFSREDALQNNAWSLLYALDHVDSRLPVVITFCDVLLLSNSKLSGDAIYCATDKTKGVVGTFRHDEYFTRHETPQTEGLLGYFVCQETIRLKAEVYNAPPMRDLTDDIIKPYFALVERMQKYYVEAVVEFGTETDLQKARQLWESL